MDRYEFNIKIEQIKKLMKKKDFDTAVKIVDSIEWRRVKENPLLIMAADVYEITGKYDLAREVLLLAYERTGLGRQLAYRLCRLSVKRGDFTEAQEFYEEFTQNSPRDAGRYILQYEMAKGRGESLDKQIKILETFIEEDMDDRWAYMLAKLYHKAHMSEKCVELCDTIILWFADGKYVEKALELKQLYVPLSENQRLKYEAQKSKKTIEEIPSMDETQPVDVSGQKEETEAAQPEEAESEQQVEGEPEEEEEGAILDKVSEMDIDVNSIHVKDFSVNNNYDTMNIQRELAKSMSNFFDNAVEVFKPSASKAEEPSEAEQEDDQIEGQMNLEEVLAMFESGEIQTKQEPEAVEEGIEEITMQQTAEEAEEIVEEPATVEDEESMEQPEAETVEEPEELESAEDAQEQMEIDEVQQLAEVIAGEIQEDIQEEIEIERQDEIEELEQEVREEVQEELEATEEEYSEEAEFEIQETDSIMFNLKEDMAEEDMIEEVMEDEVIEDDFAEVAMEDEVVEDDSAEETTEEEVVEGDSAEETTEDEVVEGDFEEETTEEAEEAPVKKVVEEVKEKQSDIAKREIKNFIAKFTGVQGLDKQILKVMQSILKTDLEPVKFIFVKGEVKSGKTTLAIDVIKLANKIIQRRDQKIAKIKGINLNDKSMESLLEVLNGSDVLIERVSDVQPEVFTLFIDKLKEEGKPRVVIFEDEKSLAENFLIKVPTEYALFPNTIDIKVNQIKEWADIAESYAKSKGYIIDEMGRLALCAKIDQLRAITLVVHRNHVEQLVDCAIKDANKFSFRNLIGKLRNKAEDGYKVLTEKDFAN